METEKNLENLEKNLEKNYKKYDGKSYREILGDLRKKMSGTEADDYVDEIKAFRKQRHKNKSATRVRTKRYAEIILALQHERKIVGAMVRYKTASPCPERVAYVQAYNAVLTKVHAMLTELKTKSRDEEAVENPPHSGQKKDHWSDYVPPHIKERVYNLSALVPQRHKAKAKEPFQRTIPVPLHNLRRGRLMRQIQAEMGTITNIIQMDDAFDAEKLEGKRSDLRRALDKLKDLSPTDSVPSTWHGLLD
tara:strand:- start:127 stop:873 length:747 start_codon:yes stop_codon:yes gene_type:complete